MKIVNYPHPALRRPTQPVRLIDRDLQRQVAEMFDLMYEARGLALAGNQVALPFRFLVMNITGDADVKEEERTFLNPRIIRSKGMIQEEEGCLSFPGLRIPVRRSQEVTVEAFDLHGQRHELHASGLEAIAWQHELDHLDGVVFIDRLSGILRNQYKSDIRLFESQYRELQAKGIIPPDTELELLLSALEQKMATTN